MFSLAAEEGLIEMNPALFRGCDGYLGPSGPASTLPFIHANYRIPTPVFGSHQTPDLSWSLEVVESPDFGSGVDGRKLFATTL